MKNLLTKRNILMVALIIVVLGSLFLVSAKVSSPTPSILGSLEAEKYHFYYPGNFVEGTSEGSEHMYMPAGENNGEGISVFYMPVDPEGDVKDASINFCTLITQAYINVKLKDFPVKPIVENLTAGNAQDRVQECSFTATNRVGENGRLTMLVRTLWYKGQNDRYVVQTFFWDTTKVEDVSALKASVAAFRLK
ncbi:MAG: hypothetical protein WC243_04555 [Patescibacteria group bacterium]|jgi:hypothetical protein